MTDPTTPTTDAPGPALAFTDPDAVRTGTVTTNDDPPTHDGQEPPRRSLLGNLAAKRRELAEHMYVDIRVPGWGDDPDEDPRVSIYVRCRPIGPSEAEAIRKERSNAGKSKAAAIARAAKGSKRREDWMDLANADLIITACLEVWAWEGEPVDPRVLDDTDEDSRLALREGDEHGRKTRLDGDLADTIGLERNMDGGPKGAVEIVRALFLTDGYLARATSQLMRYSGLVGDEEAEGFTSG